MARAGLIGFACMLQACASPQTPTPAVAPVHAKPAPFVFGDAPTGEFVSKRIGVRLHLPDGHAWRIDDHSDAFLSARHALAATSLRVLRFEPLGGVRSTHDSCWSEAIARGVFAEVQRESTVEDTPSYDGTRDVRVLLTLGGAGDEGHLRYVAADRRGCVALGIESRRLAGDTDETLADRLALLREKVLPGLVPQAAATPLAPRPWTR